VTRALGKCPACGRHIAYVNDRYTAIPTRLRAHYPKPYSYYEKHGQRFPDRYCPGRTKKDTP
jgi:hypothetical protein